MADMKQTNQQGSGEGVRERSRAATSDLAAASRSGVETASGMAQTTARMEDRIARHGADALREGAHGGAEIMRQGAEFLDETTRRGIGAIAAAQKGDPYGYGAAGPNRFDCSGLTFYSFRKAGFKGIPRTSAAQAGWVRHVRRENLRRGDLVFFTSGGRVYHVGVFAGRKNGHPQVLHSPYSGTRVRTERIWTNSWFGGKPRTA